MQKIEQKKSLIKRNILIYLENKGISKYECYQNTGISRSVLSQSNGMTEDNLLKFLAYYSDVNPEWLLTGIGPMHKNEMCIEPKNSIVKESDLPDKDTHNIDNPQKNSKKFQTSPQNPTLAKEHPMGTPDESLQKGIPLISIEAIAGYSEDMPGVALADCVRLILPDFEQLGADFAIRVHGSSMYPKYSNGDILICRRITDILFFQWGKVYVIDSSQGQLVKRVCEHPNPDMLLLVSDNKEKYPPFPIPRSDIRSLSLVLGTIRHE